MKYLFNTGAADADESCLMIDLIGRRVRIMAKTENSIQQHFLQMEELDQLVLALVDLKILSEKENEELLVK